MANPFLDSSVFTHGKFTFKVAGETLSVNARGLKEVESEEVEILFKMRSLGGSTQNNIRQAGDKYVETYDARVLGGDFSRVFPGDVGMGAVGVGEASRRESRSCSATVISISKSGVAPIVENLLGLSVRLEIDYRINRWQSS